MINTIHKIWMVLLLLSATLIFALPYLPSNAFTQLLEYSIFLSPRWMFLLLLVPIIVFWQKLTKTYFLIFTLSTFIFIHFQDINFNINPSQESPQSIKLISLNMGGGSQGKYLETLMKRERPDIFLFQETYLKYIDNTFDSLWQYQCDNGLCIASQYPFNKVGEFSRRIFGGWGNFAAYYEVDINGKTLPLMNVHLETPRTLLSALINLSVNFKDVDNFYENKSLEASMISTWASSHSMFVMAGDFNMTTNESLYKDYFSSYQNALDTVGLGLNHTKFTSWHGVRIDHTLTSNNIDIQQSKVMPSLGGDHRAVLTLINLP